MLLRWLLAGSLLAANCHAPAQHHEPVSAAADAVGTEATVDSLLRTVRLEAYTASFATEGYEFLSDLRDADTEDLRALVRAAGMRKPEGKRFFKALAGATAAAPVAQEPKLKPTLDSRPQPQPPPKPELQPELNPEPEPEPEPELHPEPEPEPAHSQHATPGNPRTSDAGGWSRTRPAALEALRCTLERRSPDEVSPAKFEAEYRNKKPLVFSGGLLDGWEAQSNWRKDAILTLYGNATAKMGSSSELVFSAGDDSVRPVPLTTAIARMSRDPGLLMFDNEWLIRQAPAILGDFEPPPHFADFSPRAKEADVTRQGGGRDTWNMISLGGAGSGLPWHTHGETWIATVYGRKAWFVYAPGDAGSTQRGSPLHDASAWFVHTLPTLSEAQRPLHCVQQPGEIVYLPAGWAHLTVNLDETIGAGAQSNIRPADVTERIKPAAQASPGDPEAKMYMAFYLQQKLARHRGVGEMREELGFGESIRKGTKRGSAKRQQDEVLRLLTEAAEHHPYEIRGKLQLADLHARLGKHKQLSLVLREVEQSLMDAEAEATVVGSSMAGADAEGMDEGGGAAAAAAPAAAVPASKVAHPLLLAEAWYRLALVYRHHEHGSHRTVRAAHRAAAASVRLSPYPAVEAVLLAYEMALVLEDQEEAMRLLAICEGRDGNNGNGWSAWTSWIGDGEEEEGEEDHQSSESLQRGGVPGCKERLEELERGVGDTDSFAPTASVSASDSRDDL